MTHPRPRSTTRIAALAAMVVVAIAGLTALAADTAQRSIRGGVADELRSLARDTAVHVRSFRSALVSDGQSMEENPVFLDLATETLHRGSDTGAARDLALWLSTLMINKGYTGASLAGLDTTVALQVPADTDLPCATPAVTPDGAPKTAVNEATGGSSSLCVSVPIRDRPAHRVIGWLLVTADPPPILALSLLPLAPGYRTAQVVVIGPDGQDALYHSGRSVLLEAAPEAAGAGISTVKVGDRALAAVDAYAALAPVPGSDWQVAATISRAEVDFRILRTVLLVCFAALGLLALILGGAAALWRRHEALRRQERDRLEQNYAWLSDAIEVGRDGVLIVDPDNLAIVYANQGAAAILGRDRESLLSLTLADVDRSLSRQALHDILEGIGAAPGLESVRETVLRRPDQRPFWAEMRAQVVTADDSRRGLVWLRDISDRREQQAEHEWLVAAIENSGDGVVVADRHETIMYVNPAVSTITGLARADLYGHPAPAVLGDPADGLDAWATATAAKQWTGVLTRVAPLGTSGPPQDIEWNITSVRNQAGDVTGTVAIARDRRRERVLEAQVARIQRLEAVGQLAAGIAHDFNNLLTAVIGYAELVRSDLPAGERASQDLTEIIAAAERGAALVRQLLAFSRRQVMEPRVLEPNEIIRTLLPMLSRLLGEHISMEIRLDEHAGSVLADPGRVEQVLVNLATNARDAMPGGGTLTIETSLVHLGEAYAAQHAEVVPGAYHLIAVSDTGIGMDQATIAHMFEPFFTTKGPDRGTGLGLATVHGIVHQSGGHIWAYSEVGQGTSFKVYLPALGPAASVEPPGELPSPGGGGETILLVEDEAPVRNLAARVLGDRGYRVLVNESAADALARPIADILGVDLLVTDIVMPGLSGPEMAAVMLDRVPGLRVLCMSGYSEHSAAHQGLSPVANDFMAKPFSVDTLARKVRDLLDAPPPGPEDVRRRRAATS